METRILKATEENIAKCAEMLRKGEIVAFPTETVYGLGANAVSDEAPLKIFQAKGRPATNPLIIHVANKEQIAQVAEVDELSQKLIEKLMPGALTLVLPKKPIVPDIVTAGFETVAVRMPDHPVALKLIEEAGVPVCAPSANTSSRPSPTRAEHVYDDLNGRIPVILDGGKCPLGLESTIINMTTTPPRVIRAGYVEVSRVEEIIGKVNTDSLMVDQLAALKTPTVFVPKAEIICSAYYENMEDIIKKYYDVQQKLHGKVPVILCMESNKDKYGTRAVITVGNSVKEYAGLLFEKLREAEKQNFDVVIAEGVPMEGIGTTLMSRLMKLSSGKVI